MKITSQNENLNCENIKMNKQIVSLIKLLQSKDDKLNFYVKNEKFMNEFKKNLRNKLIIKLKLILIKKLNWELNKVIVKGYYMVWRLKSLICPIRQNKYLSEFDKFKLQKKVEISLFIDNFSNSKTSLYLIEKFKFSINSSIVSMVRNSYSTEHFRISITSTIKTSNIFLIEKFKFSLFKTQHKLYSIGRLEFSIASLSKKKMLSINNFCLSIRSPTIKYLYSIVKFSLSIESCLHKYAYFTVNLLIIFKKLSQKNIFHAFSKIIKYAHFNTVKNKLILFKNVLLHKKIKFIFAFKKIKELKFYFEKLKSQIIKKSDNKHFNEKNLILAKIILKHHYGTKNSISCRFLYKWINQTLKFKSITHSEILSQYQSIEEDFMAKLNDIENTYEANIEKVLIRNKELESKVKECNIEKEKYKSTQQEQNRNISELTEIIEQNKNDEEMISLKNKINILHEKYVKDFEKLKEENNSLKDANEQFSRDYEKRKIEKSQNEKKILYLSTTNEKLTQDLNECLKKYENLKTYSSQTAEEFIKTNNEISKLKLENKKLSDNKISLIEAIEKLSNESTTKERLIKQLKLNEDTLNMQFATEKERLENKNLNEKKIMNEKIEFLQDEKESLKEALKNSSRENKNLTEKLKISSDYNLIKKEVTNLKDKIVCFENENKSAKIQNNNLQKQIEKLIENLANESKKYETTKLELEELRTLSKDSKEDLGKALEEMEGYANLLVAFEQKIKEAETAKLNAEKERDEAIEDVKKIRQRYINILDNKAF